MLTQSGKQRTWYERLLRIEPGISLYQWASDRIWNNWERLALLSLGSGSLTLAAVKDWVWNVGPIGWVLAFFAGLILTLLMMWLYEVVASRGDMRKAVRAVANRPSGVNILAPEFRDQRIGVSDFFNVFLLPNAGKTFTNCEMIGPGDVLLRNTTMLAPMRFHDCQFVLVRPDRPISSVAVFDNCRFLGGAFVKCTFFIDAAMLMTLRQMFPGQELPLITYEPPQADPS